MIVTMLPAVAATSFDGKGECFPGHAIEVELWCKVTNAEGCKRSSALVLQRESTARDVCMALSTGKLPGLDGGALALTVPRDYVASDDLDTAYQDVVRLWHFKRSSQTVGDYW